MVLTECPDDQQLGQVLDGALTGQQRADLEQHLDVCTTCRMTLSHACLRDGAAPSDQAGADDDEIPGVGAHVGRYQLCDVLGAGGMGVVYAARDPELDRRVAVKVLRDDLEPGAGDERLRAEAQTLARISHPNVLTVYDVGRVGGRRFLAMELVDGTTLRGYLAQHALAWRDRLRLLVDVGRGLAAAHAVGVVHRDVKPDNVLIGVDGRPRVSDFGLARSTVPGHVGGDGTVSTAAGTPAYLAPEVRSGARATAASDQYAFATMCWEILLGARPATPPSAPRRPRDRRRVLVALERALAETPTARWPSVTALVDALVAAARPRRRALAVLAATAAIATATAVALIVAGGRADREPAACGPIAARATALWTPARIAAMRDAFARSDESQKAILADTAEAGLRRASDDWRTSALAACRRDPAGFATGAGPAACLERSYAQADSLAVLFASVDQTLVNRTVGLIANLPSSASCLDGRELLEPPRPAHWLALVRRLASTYPDIDLGRGELARATVEAVARDAEAAGAPALHAEAMLILAEIERVGGRLEEAHRLIRDAVTEADQAGADQVRGRGLIELGRLAARDLMRPDEAAEALELARAVVARLGEPPVMAVHLAQTQADLAMARAQPSVAIEHLRHALEVIQAENLTRWESSAHNDLGVALFGAGRYQEALAEFERILAANPAREPGRALAAIHINIAGALTFLDRVDEAIEHSELAATMLRGLGESRQLAQVLGNLGYMYGTGGRLELALATSEESLHVTERVLGGAHADVAMRTKNLADLQREAGHPEQAIASYRQACELFTAALGDHAPDLADPLTSLAELELEAGDAAAALAAVERASAIRRAATEAGVESTPAWLENSRLTEDVFARARAAMRRR